MLEKEKLIKEQRLMEATRKGIIGLEGKFGVILKYLGQPILYQTSYHDETYLPDVYAVPDEETMPVFDEDQDIVEVGRIFDGLRYGIHLEIKYIDNRKELMVTYQGYTVYCEMNNELECYVPRDEWEEKLEGLYVMAKKNEKTKIKEIKSKNKAINKGVMEVFLEKLKMKWGI